jgi:hypothetical protein
MGTKTASRRRSRAVWLTCLLCLTLLPHAAPAAPRHALADAGARLGPAPVYTGREPLLAGALAAATTGPTVNPASRAASAAFFADWFLAAPTPPLDWTGDFATCQKGTTADAFKEAVRQRLLYYRAMAGVPTDVAFSTIANDKVQQAALMIGKADALSHSPDPTWPFALGRNGWQAVDRYVWDYGEDNAGVPHRRWLLYPQTRTFGTGDIPAVAGLAKAANALWVLDENVAGPRPATRDGFVAWPPPGYVPYQVAYPRWSFSYPPAASPCR